MNIRTALPLVILILLWAPLLHAQDAHQLLMQGKREFFIADTMSRSAQELPRDSVLRHYQRAIDALQKAIQADPSNQEAHYFLAYAYDRYETPFSPGASLPATNLALTRKVSHELEQSLALSPHYRGDLIILNPQQKLTSTWGSLALAYAVNGKKDSARWAFTEGKRLGGFSDLLLESCRNILASCDSNAVLLVNGDMDTFPMWYLQTVESYRRDVTIVNLSLTNATWYTQSIKSFYPFGNNALALNYSDQDLVHLSTVSVKPGQTETIVVPKDVLAKSGAPKNAKGSIVLPVAGRNYGPQTQLLLAQDLVLLDLIRANKWRRPIYLSSTVNPEEVLVPLGLEDYQRVEGLASRLMPRKFDASQGGEIDLERTSRLLMGEKGFKWNALRQSGASEESASASMTYLYPFLRAAQGYAVKGDTATARALLDRLQLVLPLAENPQLYGPQVLEILETLYTAVGRAEQFQTMLKRSGGKQ